jgi:hypothetical protein
MPFSQHVLRGTHFRAELWSFRGIVGPAELSPQCHLRGQRWQQRPRVEHSGSTGYVYPVWLPYSLLVVTGLCAQAAL